PDVRLLDAHARAARAPGGSRGLRARRAAALERRGRPAAGEGAARSAGVGAAARARAEIHPVRHRRWRAAPDRWDRAARGAGAGLLRTPDTFLRRAERYEDRTGGDLRTGLHDPALRR